MPFNIPTFNVTRLRITDMTPETFSTAASDLLRNSFQSIDDLPESKSVGWVNTDDMLDAEWKVSPPQKGAYLAFSLRVDTRRVPPATLKKECRKALQQEEEAARAAGRKLVSRERKKEIQAAVKAKLEMRTPPTPKVIDVIVDEQSATVYLSTTTPKEIELFKEIFTRTFDVHTEPLDGYGLAVESFPEKRDAIDLLEDRSFGSGSGAGLPLPTGAIVGRDFLTFAWFFSECRQGAFTGIDGRRFTLDVIDTVTVTDANGARVSAGAGESSADNLSEAKLGISKGKKVISAKFRMERDEEVYSFKLDQNLSLSGLRLPPIDRPEEGDDPDSAFFERVYLMDQCWAMLDCAYATFLAARLNIHDADAWTMTAGDINNWLRQGVAGDALNA